MLSVLKKEAKKGHENVMSSEIIASKFLSISGKISSKLNFESKKTVEKGSLDGSFLRRNRYRDCRASIISRRASRTAQSSKTTIIRGFSPSRRISKQTKPESMERSQRGAGTIFSYFVERARFDRLHPRALKRLLWSGKGLAR